MRTRRSTSVAMALFRWLVIARPLVALSVLGAVLFFSAFGLGSFHLDASSDSLVLESDTDLELYREVTQRYGSSEFLLLVYTPEGDLFSRPILAEIRHLREELRALPGVAGVTTLLDVPLFRNPPVAFAELGENTKRLEDPEADLEMARSELIESPIYRDRLVSRDGLRTALVIDLSSSSECAKVFERRNELRLKRKSAGLSPTEEEALSALTEMASVCQGWINEGRHTVIENIRQLMKRYPGGLYLGGVPMIADDMMTFIRSDLRVFGVVMSALLLLTLGLIFRRLRWVFLPMLCCAVSVVVMMGFLGHTGWPVTVISSNFISLQLVLTLALSIHLVVRFNELQRATPDRDQADLVAETVATKFVPCVFTTLTTIAGFSSLVMSGIVPVIDFGWMMTIGLAVSLGITFLLFPAVLSLLPPMHAPDEEIIGATLTRSLAEIADRHRYWVVGVSGVVALITVLGISRLRVENSFIDYFRESTDIYQGMRVIDDHLGGTVPLDVLIDFSREDTAGESETENGAGAEPADSEFAGFEEFDLEDPEEDTKYWFTQDRMQTIHDVHVYLESIEAVGNVMSLDSVVRVAENLSGGEPLDGLSLAILFNDLGPDERAQLLDPYVSLEHDQARIAARIKDSFPGLRRGALLRQIKADLEGKLHLEGRVQIAGLMVLYNNMLESLFSSQIETAGMTMLVLWVMILILFGSYRIATIALVPNLVASTSMLGVMGWLDLPLDMMTITVVAICIGIAIDHTIHYCHRFERELQVDGDYRGAMYRAHQSVGSAMLYTSITIIVGFSILALSNFIPTVTFGLLTALAMALAPVASLTLLPVLLVWVRPFRIPEGAAAGD